MAVRRLTGRCLCERVAFSVEDAFDYAFNCHCSQCRRRTGAAFKPIAGIERRALQVERGEDRLQRLGDGPCHDVMCGACGSLIYSVVREGAFVHVPMGTLVDDPTIRAKMHIHVGSKAPWFTITDALPQYETLPET